MWPKPGQGDTVLRPLLEIEEDVFLCHQGFQLIDYESDVEKTAMLGEGLLEGQANPGKQNGEMETRPANVFEPPDPALPDWPWIPQ